MFDSEIISAKSETAKSLLRDFRTQKNGIKIIAQLLGEGKLLGETQKYFVRYLSWDAWQGQRPPFLIRWIKAFRLSYLWVSLLPLLGALASSHVILNATTRARFALAILATICFQLSAQLWNDFEDHLRGIDSPANLGGSGVIQRLWIPALHLKFAALFFLCVGSIAGMVLLYWCPWSVRIPLLVLGLCGAFGAISYSGWPWHYRYHGLGEAIVFLLAGPLLFLAGGILATDEPQYFFWYLLAGVPLGLLAFTRLHAGNMHKIPFDRLAKSKTLANMVSFDGAKKIFLWSLLAPYLATTLLVWFKILPPHTLVVWISFPLVLVQWKISRQIRSPMDPSLKELRGTTAWQHIVFGAIFVLSFLTSIFGNA